MNFLTDKAEKVFELLSGYEILSQFTFVGGSAIAYYLNHRLSEDLDFFTWEEYIPVNIENLFNSLQSSNEITFSNKSSSIIDLFIDDIKVTFFANNWNALKRNRKKLLNNIYIAELPLLCSMKINTLSLRAKFRDYYVLYVLNREKYDINEMFNFAVSNIPGMTKKIFAMQLSYIGDIEDEHISHLEPKYQISLK